MLLWMDFSNRYLWACLFITVGFGADRLPRRLRQGEEAQPQGRLGQGAAARRVRRRRASAAGSSSRAPAPSSTSPSTTGRWSISGRSTSSSPPSSIVAFGNAVNLTDGLDGLATMPVIIASLAFLRHRLSGRQRDLRRLSRHPARAGRGRPHRALLGDRRRGPRLPLVQRAAGGGLHGRHRQPRARRRARRDRGRDPARDRARHHRRPVRGRGDVA